MTQLDLKQFGESLPLGSKTKLAVKLNCDPAKITKAFNGLVRSRDFMAKLIREANEMIQEVHPA